MPPSQSTVWLAALAAGLWSVGALLQGRLTVLEVLLIEATALSVATGSENLVLLHRVFKPLAMLLAIACVVQRNRATKSPARFDLLQLAQ